jgi:hypothetical protein
VNCHIDYDTVICSIGGTCGKRWLTGSHLEPKVAIRVM